MLSCGSEYGGVKYVDGFYDVLSVASKPFFSQSHTSRFEKESLVGRSHSGGLSHCGQ